MIKTVFLSLLLVLAFIISCNKQPIVGHAQILKETSTITKKLDLNNINLIGIYRGIIPCNDCKGIETALTLFRNHEYKLSSLYLGKGSTDPILTKGYYYWNEEKNKITLDYDKIQFKVENNKLIELDQDGKIITGKLAPNYILAKQMININR